MNTFCAFKKIKKAGSILTLFILIALSFTKNTHACKKKQNEIHIVYGENKKLSLNEVDYVSEVFKLNLRNFTKYKTIFNDLKTQNLQQAFFDHPNAKISAKELYKTFKIRVKNKIIKTHVHDKSYIQSLTNSLHHEKHKKNDAFDHCAMASKIFGIAPMSNYFKNIILENMLWATAGTVKATDLALEYGCAINIGGGFHEAKYSSGQNFCCFADIPFALLTVLEKHPDYKVLIVSLTKNRSDGLADFLSNNQKLSKRIFLFNIYNKNEERCSYQDYRNQEFIKFNISLPKNCTTEEYLKILTQKLPAAITAIKDKKDMLFIMYNTDIFDGTVERDEFVFETAFNNNCPIVMLTGSNYTKESISGITNSIANLVKKFVSIN